jgi:uncharacterized protein YutE (UPF0331/DUF86 family)
LIYHTTLKIKSDLLITIKENKMKKYSKVFGNKELLLKVANKEYWSKIIKTREIISHHYINLDAEIVFEICDKKLDELQEKVLKLKDTL